MFREHTAIILAAADFISSDDCVGIAPVGLSAGYLRVQRQNQRGPV
jgi:hypothetical protein